MIASVAGAVAAVRLDSVVVSVGGFGVQIQATPTTLAGLRVGQPCELATSMVVREDALTLYGFADTDERDTFELVQTVTGVGPRLALATLAVLTPQALRRAIAEEDLATLCKVPGIGRKGAGRMVLDLADKIGAPDPGQAAPATPTGPDTSEVTAALVGLGWTLKQAEPAVAAALQQRPDADVATLLRVALRGLGGAG